MDRISNLPSCIIETILCLLPIKEAVRTSILSRGWRYKWTKIPKLEFHEYTQASTNGVDLPISEQVSHETSKREKMVRRFKFFNAIYQVLLMHEGPILEFCLSMEVDMLCVEIDNILLHLSKNITVKKLILYLDGHYKLPASLFSLHNLTELCLVGCAIYLPPQFGGFGSLTYLYLDLLWTIEKTLLLLLSGCPLLKRLDLGEDVIIYSSGESTTRDLFKCLPAIEDLCILFPIFLCFIPDRLMKEYPVTLVHLKYFDMEGLCFTHKYSFPFLALLIRSSPNLEKLTLAVVGENVFDEDETCSFTIEDYADLRLEHLNKFKILKFRNSKYELDFIKLILAKSLALKKAKIILLEERPKRGHEESQDEEPQIRRDEESQAGECHGEKPQTRQILEILLSCQRASPIAKISVEYNYNSLCP